jgi:anion-transporting  ArsA/GET3 family ATPase
LPQYPHIDAMMLDRKYSSDQLVRKCAQSPEQAELILKNKYYQAFSSSLAGTQEYMAIYEINQAVQKNRYDLIIVDTPPSKHAIDFLDTPQKLIQALNQKIIFQMLGKKEGFSAGQLILKSLGKLTAGPFLEELFQFILLFREVLEGLKSNAISLIELLKKNTEVIMVSTLQQESMLLSIELKKQLTERAIPVHALLINRCQKPLLDHEQAFDLALKSCLEENRFWFDLIEQKEKKHQERYLEEKKQLEGLKNHFKTQKIIQLYLKDEDQQTDGFDQELNGFDF